MNAERIAAARALVPAEIREGGVLKVGASYVNQPHAYRKAGTEEWTGYEIDLVKKIGELLDLKVEITPIPWIDMIPTVASGQFHTSLGDLGNTDVRQKIVDFVCHSRLNFDLQVADEDLGKVTSIWDLCGRTLSTVKGTFNVIEPTLRAGCEMRGLPPAQFVEFATNDEKREAVKAGKVSGSDSAAAGVARTRAKAGLSRGITLLHSDEMGGLYLGFVVNKANYGLSQAMDSILFLLFANGTYNDIMKAHDATYLKIESPGINIGYRAEYYVQSKPAA
ncbi:MAG: substrate-binding periplasmic protein [Devosia sp.]